MNDNIPEICKDTMQLHVIEGSENALIDEPQMDLEEERKHIQEKAAAEEFWAGRNLADRNSTRRAA
jgi:hypothetical protein